MANGKRSSVLAYCALVFSLVAVGLSGAALWREVPTVDSQAIIDRTCERTCERVLQRLLAERVIPLKER